MHAQDGPPQEDRPQMHNVMFRLDVGGVRFLHLGDNRAEIPARVRRQLGPVDLLMIPVDDSCHVLSFDRVNSLIESFGPKVVIPVHYLIPGLTTEQSTLKLPIRWLAAQPVVRELAAHTIRLSPQDLPPVTEVWVPTASPESYQAPPATRPNSSSLLFIDGASGPWNPRQQAPDICPVD